MLPCFSLVSYLPLPSCLDHLFGNLKSASSFSLGRLLISLSLPVSNLVCDFGIRKHIIPLFSWLWFSSGLALPHQPLWHLLSLRHQPPPDQYPLIVLQKSQSHSSSGGHQLS